MTSDPYFYGWVFFMLAFLVQGWRLGKYRGEASYWRTRYETRFECDEERAALVRPRVEVASTTVNREEVAAHAVKRINDFKRRGML